LKKKYPKMSEDLIRNAKDIDNVRPLGRIMEWIYYRIKNEDKDQVRKAFDEAFDRVIKEMLGIEVVQKWRSPETNWDEAIRAMSSPWLKWLPKGVLDMLEAEDLLWFFLPMAKESDDPEEDPYIRGAYGERIRRENRNIRYILYGHTHVPLQAPLDGDREEEVIYLNTGTWRNRISRTVGLDHSPDFIELKQMTYKESRRLLYPCSYGIYFRSLVIRILSIFVPVSLCLIIKVCVPALNEYTPGFAPPLLYTWSHTHVSVPP
jgi:hypothetical protein